MGLNYDEVWIVHNRGNIQAVGVTGDTQCGVIVEWLRLLHQRAQIIIDFSGTF
jgi:hypothetical protein